MQSRRDQVQAQSYVLGRLTSALVMAEPEAPENPHRRIIVGTIGGLLVGALVVAGFVVYGFLKPGGASSWREPGTLVVERETGGRFVYVDGALRPVLNYSSAVLLFGKRPTLTTVASASLRSVPRGTAVGIVGAPETLPDVAGLQNTAWTVCAVARRDSAGTLYTATTLAIGRWTPDRVLDARHGIAVRTSDGKLFLVWKGARFALTRDWLVRAMGYDGPLVTVEPGWLEQLPAGSDMAPLSVPRRGEPGPTVNGRPTRIGQVFVARVIGGDAERFYLLQGDGLSQLTATGAAMMLGDPATAAAYGSGIVEPVEIPATALAQVPTSKRPAFSSDLPEVPPVVAPGIGPDQAWCVRSGPDGTVDVTVEPIRPAVVSSGTGVSRTEQTAAAVSMAAGVGGLVRLGRAGQAPGSSFVLVTDAGVKYPLADESVAKALGYPPDDAATVPAELLALLPTGPLLDPAEARR